MQTYGRSCSFCDCASSSDLFLIGYLMTSLCWGNDGVAWHCSREACKERVLVKCSGAPPRPARPGPARLKHWLTLAQQWKSDLWSCSSRSVLPAGTGCDSVCVKAAPAQRLSSSDHWSPAPVAPVVLQLDSLLAFLYLWSAVSAQSAVSQWSGWAQ